MEVTNPTPNPSPKERGGNPTPKQIAQSAICPKERGEIVFFISNKKDNITKLTKSTNTIKEGVEFVIKFCKEFDIVTPLAFSHKTLESSIKPNQLYYYDDTEVLAYLDNQMRLDDLLENNWCDALVRNTEDLLALDTEIDSGSLFLVRGDYAYYLSDYSIRIPLVDLEHVVINLS